MTLQCDILKILSKMRSFLAKAGKFTFFTIFKFKYYQKKIDKSKLLFQFPAAAIQYDVFLCFRHLKL